MIKLLRINKEKYWSGEKTKRFIVKREKVA